MKLDWSGYTIRDVSQKEFDAYEARVNAGVQLAPFQGKSYYCLGCHGRLGSGAVDKTAGLRGIPCAHHELYRGAGKIRARYPVFPAKPASPLPSSSGTTSSSHKYSPTFYSAKLAYDLIIQARNRRSKKKIKMKCPETITNIDSNALGQTPTPQPPPRQPARAVG
jgi:hypothetical protein